VNGLRTTPIGVIVNVFMSRNMRVPLLAFIALASAHPVAAQTPRLTAAELGQIVDAVFDTLARPTTTFSRVPLAQRTLVFDAGRTLAAFQRVGVSGVFADLHLRTPIKQGTQALLDDCRQAGRLPCDRLGWSVYAWFDPVTVTDSLAVVRATFLWPDRGNTPFVANVSPTGGGYLAGFTSEVFLVRARDGSWKFSRVGSTAVGQ
jgi:hypothetical protein